jgi:uncharacterized protein YceH (UPF0502 family)
MIPVQAPKLSAIEARVLGVLVEKEHTVPDTYPLSLNALVAGCNQKSSRDPVMEATGAQVMEALDSLRGPALIIESSGGRVSRYAHNMDRVLQLPSQSVALLAVLMLRGPQTAAELRLNCERLHRFADSSAVEGFLAELAERPAGALVKELPRQPGTRENRWIHLLGDVEAGEEGMAAAAPASEPAALAGGGVAALEARLAALEAEVTELRTLVDRLREGPGTAS